MGPTRGQAPRRIPPSMKRHSHALLRAALPAATFLFLAGCTTVPHPSAAPDALPKDPFADALAPDPEAHVAKALAPLVERGTLPGAVSIVCDGDRTEVSCLGYADVAAKRPITLDDAYMQCSQTKGFCGVTAAILVEEGKLSLDDPVSKYLPEFKTLWVLVGETNGVRTLRRAGNELTVRMCLNHMGGFPFEIPAKQRSIPGGGWSGGMPVRSVAATAAAQPLLFEPGTQTKYSNTGIDIAAAVVQTIAGEPWDRFLQERVLDPLGMTETRFKPTKEQIAGHVEMYTVDKDGVAAYREQNDWEQRPYDGDHVFPSAGAGLWTTARDQVKFYRMLMNGGVGDNGARILKEETVRGLLATTSRPAGFANYSLGLNASEDGRGWFGHGGAWGTNCQVDMERRRLKLWAVQISGDNRPWEKERAAAEDAFFAEALDRTDETAYTGRTE